MHDIIFCFEQSDKKYYGAILSPATNIAILNLFQDFFLSFQVFSQSSPNLLLFSFLYVRLAWLIYYHSIVVCKAFIGLWMLSMKSPILA
jgi:hypothetical protein